MPAAKKGRGRPPKSSRSSPETETALASQQKSLIDGNNNDNPVSTHTQSQEEMVREPANDREVSMDEADQEDETVTNVQDQSKFVVTGPEDECFTKLEEDVKDQYLAIMAEMTYDQLYLHDYDDIKDKDMRMVARWCRSQQRIKIRHDLKMQAVDRENAKWDTYDQKKKYDLYRFWLKKKTGLLSYLVTEENQRKKWFDEEKERRAKDLVEQRANFKAMAEENRAKIAALSDSQKEVRKQRMQVTRKANSERDQAGLILPVRRIRANLKKYLPRIKQTKESAVFMAAVMEYLAAEVLELAGNNAEQRNIKKKSGERKTTTSRITPRDIMIATMNDEEIMKFMGPCQFKGAGCFPAGVLPMLRKNVQGMTNEEWYGASKGHTNLYMKRDDAM